MPFIKVMKGIFLSVTLLQEHFKSAVISYIPKFQQTVIADMNLGNLSAIGQSSCSC